MNAPLRARVDGVYAGRVQAMPGDGRPTAIFKTPVDGAVRIDSEGLVGDAQADRRVHGGPDKAIHHFPQEHFARFADEFDAQAAQFVPGCMGENVSTRGCTEADVCIGDVFALGGARVQLSQPRSPCWKINARHGVDGLAEMIDFQGIAGWYYRVLAPGRLRVGDAIELIERDAGAISLREYWRLKQALRPDLGRVARLIATPGLAAAQRARWQQRLDWLRKA